VAVIGGSIERISVPACSTTLGLLERTNNARPALQLVGAAEMAVGNPPSRGLPCRHRQRGVMRYAARLGPRHGAGLRDVDAGAKR
jgi:hypothetical protein